MKPDARHTSSLILAAGMGTRLLPYTDGMPKCMVTLGRHALVEYQIGVLEEFGISDISIVGGYHAEVLERLRVNIIVNSEFDKTNMVWSMMCARQLFDGKRTIVLSYGDIVYERDVLSALLATPGGIVVVSDRAWRKIWQLRMEDPLSDAETFLVGEDGGLKELGKKPSSYGEIQGQYIGLIKFEPESHGTVLNAFDKLLATADSEKKRRSIRNMYMTDFIQHFVDQDVKVGIAWTEGKWLEVDTVSDRALYEELLEAGKLKDFCRLPVLR